MTPTLSYAVRALAARRDGAQTEDGTGFNRLDAPFFKGMAARPEAKWTDRQRYAVWRMLAKYRGQLAGIGIDYDALPRPAMPTGPTNDRVLDVLNPQEYRLQFPFAPDVVAEVKKLNNRRFHRGSEDENDPRTYWRVVSAPDTVVDLVNLALTFDFAITEPALARIEESFRRFEENDRASRAQESDFFVPPLGGELRSFQVAAVELAVRSGRLLNADDMGLGKTIDSLASLEAMGAYPALVICPSGVKRNWAREARKWLPGRSVLIVSGRRRLENYDADIVIMNYDIASVHIPVEAVAITIGGRSRTSKVMSETPLKHMPWRGLIIDEITNIKNHKALRSMAVAAFASTFARRLTLVLGLTGTPILNRPAELLTPLKVLGILNDLGGWPAFNAQYVQHGNESSLAALNGRLRALGRYIRRHKRDVLTELPEKTRTPIEVDLANRAVYDKAEADMVGYLIDLALADESFYKGLAGLAREERESAIEARRKGAEVRARSAEQLRRYSVLRQLVAEGKLTALKEWLTDFMDGDEKIIIFADHVAIQQAILEMCAPYNPAQFLGGQGDAFRQAEVDRFQTDPTCRVIVCSERAGGMGITLTAASHVVMYEPPWTPAVNDQCEDRAYRMGQRNAVNVWQFLGTDSIDGEMMAIIDHKRGLMEAVTEGNEVNEQLATLAELNERLLARYRARGARRGKGVAA